MALDTAFVAAVLEGIESTLGELIERVEGSELQASLDVLGDEMALPHDDVAIARNLQPDRMQVHAIH